MCVDGAFLYRVYDVTRPGVRHYLGVYRAFSEVAACHACRKAIAKTWQRIGPRLEAVAVPDGEASELAAVCRNG